jgi:anti-anti-sigma regulatory factor
VPDVEYSALQALMEGEQRARDQGVEVWLAGLNPSVQQVVSHAGLAARLGPERLAFNAREALARYLSRTPAAGTAHSV